MAKKQLLGIQHDFDFVLIGIACHHKDYRLCFEVNHTLGLNLKKTEDLETQINHHRETSAFSMYSFDNGSSNSYHVVSNKGSKDLLIPEQKAIDYFFLIKGPVSNDETKEIATLLKNVKIILGVFELNPIELKSKENLLF